MAYLIVGINTMLIVIFFVTAEKALEYKQAAVKMLATGFCVPISTRHFCVNAVTCSGQRPM